jgi:hypothetical protein
MPLRGLSGERGGEKKSLEPPPRGQEVTIFPPFNKHIYLSPPALMGTVGVVYISLLGVKSYD